MMYEALRQVNYVQRNAFNYQRRSVLILLTEKKDR